MELCEFLSSYVSELYFDLYIFQMFIVFSHLSRFIVCFLEPLV